MQTKPLKKYYANAGLLCEIDADGTAGEVYERVKSIIGRLA
jgi:adenylate kinase family enzyme